MTAQIQLVRIPNKFNVCSWCACIVVAACKIARRRLALSGGPKPRQSAEKWHACDRPIAEKVSCFQRAADCGKGKPNSCTCNVNSLYHAKTCK